ncbi:MAG: response regulator [Candidatus Omnitrophica bacterium]|nr:Chemotaxis response regulator protein-glutamate methylesterase [bacterium]NUN98174.1 response regulator [Candidatus Omnitrophota bacterium]
MRLRGEGKRVVIADDAPEVVDLMTIVLEQRGYEVISFNNGRDAWTRIPEIQPHAVLLDILMPGMDGLEVCSSIKADPELAKTPVILMTSVTAGSEIADGLWKIGTDADAFFSKPFNPLEIAAHVDRFIFGTEIPPELNRGGGGGAAARVEPI